MSLDVTVTDLFCGAGGSSLGAEAAGARLRMAANHWRLAIDTHNSNFPDADHDCADVSQVDPRRYPRTDVLIASPECTAHSKAKSHKRPSTLWDAGDPAEERSRATMWDVPRFAEHHRYELVVVENVVEAMRWEPYEAWLAAMRALGYDHRAVFLNSMVAHPTPQSRDRLYVVFWRRGNTAPDLDFRVRAWCPACQDDVEGIQSWKRPDRPFGKYRTQYVYRCPTCAAVALPYAWPAAAAIDWSLAAPRIGDRARPLADATVRRIRAGLDRYGPAAIVQGAGHTFERPGCRPCRRRARATGRRCRLTVRPEWHDEGVRRRCRFWSGTASRWASRRRSRCRRRARRAVPVCVPSGLPQRPGPVVTSASPAVIRERWPCAADPQRPWLRHDPRARAWLCWLVCDRRPIQAPRDPVPTIVAGSRFSKPIDAPMGALITQDQTALLIRNYGSDSGAEMARPVDAPTGTVTAVDHHSLLVPYNRTGPAQLTTEPHRTVDTRDRYGLIETAVDVEDCGFRMLEPHEIGRAMAFPDSYNVLGNKRERVRQYGNAVTPPVMGLILQRVIGSLAP